MALPGIIISPLKYSFCNPKAAQHVRLIWLSKHQSRITKSHMWTQRAALQQQTAAKKQKNFEAVYSAE